MRIEKERLQDSSMAALAWERHAESVAGAREAMIPFADDHATVVAWGLLAKEAAGESRLGDALPRHLAVAILLMGDFAPLQVGLLAGSLGLFTTHLGARPEEEPVSRRLRQEVDRSRRFWVWRAGKNALAFPPAPGQSGGPLRLLASVEQLAGTQWSGIGAPPPRPP